MLVGSQKRNFFPSISNSYKDKRLYTRARDCLRINKRLKASLYHTHSHEIESYVTIFISSGALLRHLLHTICCPTFYFSQQYLYVTSIPFSSRSLTERLAQPARPMNGGKYHSRLLVFTYVSLAVIPSYRKEKSNPRRFLHSVEMKKKEYIECEALLIPTHSTMEIKTHREWRTQKFEGGIRKAYTRLLI